MQRSQLDNVLVGTQPLPEEEEEQGVGDNVAAFDMGSAPAGDIRFTGPSQPEVSRPPRAAAPTQVGVRVGTAPSGRPACVRSEHLLHVGAGRRTCFLIH